MNLKDSTEKYIEGFFLGGGERENDIIIVQPQKTKEI